MCVLNEELGRKSTFLASFCSFWKERDFFHYQKVKVNGTRSLVFSAALRKYLLEKSRLVCQAPEERYVLDILLQCIHFG